MITRILKYAAIGLGIAASLLLVLGYQADIPAAEIENKYRTETSRFIDIDGLRVHYSDEGTGPVLMLIHGTTSSIHTWNGWARRLRDDFRVVRMDLPAFGLTGPNAAADYRITTYVEFVESFRNALGIRRMHVAGNSLGGNIAWQYGAAHTGSVESLILIDPAGLPRDRTPLLIHLGSAPLLSDVITWITPKWVVRNQVENVYGDPSRIEPGVVDRYFDLLLRQGNREAFKIYTRQLPPHGPYEELKHFPRPVLIMWGDRDRLIEVELAARFDELIPDSRVIIYEGVGHIPMEEIPERSAADAREFMQGL